MAFGGVEIGIMNPMLAPNVAPRAGSSGDTPAAVATAIAVGTTTVAAAVLKELYAQRDQLVQAIYEISGISDVLRGSTDAQETLGAQQIKANFGSLRLKERQKAEEARRKAEEEAAMRQAKLQQLAEKFGKR
jgi:hypothetical protein